ncbi:unannotated protein [freshwater metagenome]|uniref:Unannotated protein n=1 Tax=freshwater metagenome TaxID=449393 RepID=A0A6J6F2V7_9ZZZZ
MYDCTPDGYYPSEIDGYEIWTIDGQRSLCDFLYRCHLWPQWDSAAVVVLGAPDYLCDAGGQCLKP